MPTTPPSLTGLPTPPDPNDRATFNPRAYPWSAALNTHGTELAALGANVYANAVEAEADAATAAAASISATAAQAAAEAASNATAWVSGTTYTAGQVRYSPVNWQSYRRTTNGAGATDPSADPTNWASLGVSASGTATLTNKTLGAGTVFSSDALARIQAAALCF